MRCVLRGIESRVASLCGRATVVLLLLLPMSARIKKEAS